LFTAQYSNAGDQKSPTALVDKQKDTSTLKDLFQFRICRLEFKSTQGKNFKVGGYIIRLFQKRSTLISYWKFCHSLREGKSNKYINRTSTGKYRV
jgi:hypothetical protein